MLTAMKGVYNNGKVILAEDPQIDTKTDVIVTFLPGNKDQANKGGQKSYFRIA